MTKNKKKQDDSKAPAKPKDRAPTYWGRLKDEIRGSFKKGGRVKHTGKYRLHKGEVVVPAKRARDRRSKSR